jgi:hypothetical protein
MCYAVERRTPGRSLLRSGHHGVSCTRTVAASRVEEQRTTVMSSGGLEGVADVGPYRVKWQVRQHPVPACSTRWSCCHSARRGFVLAGAATVLLTVAGMAPRRPSASS